jgi:hypothetical protein
MAYDPAKDPNLFYTYETYPWNTVPVHAGWEAVRKMSEPSGRIYYRTKGIPGTKLAGPEQLRHPSIYTTGDELARLSPDQLLLVPPWQIKWDTITPPIPDSKDSRMSTDFKYQMINRLIRFSKSCGETINDRAMSLEEKGRNLNILGAEYYREITRLRNMLNDARALEVLNLPTPTYKPKGGLRKTGKRRKTIIKRKNRKTRRRR